MDAAILTALDIFLHVENFPFFLDSFTIDSISGSFI